MADEPRAALADAIAAPMFAAGEAYQVESAELEQLATAGVVPQVAALAQERCRGDDTDPRHRQQTGTIGDPLKPPLHPRFHRSDLALQSPEPPHCSA